MQKTPYLFLVSDMNHLKKYGPELNPTHRPLSSSFWGLPYRTLNMNHKKELLGSLWVVAGVESNYIPYNYLKPPSKGFRMPNLP